MFKPWCSRVIPMLALSAILLLWFHVLLLMSPDPKYLYCRTNHIFLLWYMMIHLQLHLHQPMTILHKTWTFQMSDLYRYSRACKGCFYSRIQQSLNMRWGEEELASLWLRYILSNVVLTNANQYFEQCRLDSQWDLFKLFPFLHKCSKVVVFLIGTN